jgi:hypothetical protein
MRFDAIVRPHPAALESVRANTGLLHDEASDMQARCLFVVVEVEIRPDSRNAQRLWPRELEQSRHAFDRQTLDLDRVS